MMTLLRTIDLTGGFTPDEDYESLQTVPAALTDHVTAGNLHYAIYLYTTNNAAVAGTATLQAIGVHDVGTKILVRGAVPDSVNTGRGCQVPAVRGMLFGVRVSALTYGLATRAEIWYENA